MEITGKCPKVEQRVEKRNKQGRLYLEVDKTKRTKRGVRYGNNKKDKKQQKGCLSNYCFKWV